MKTPEETNDLLCAAEAARDEQLAFLSALAPIPAPSRKEDRRVAFLLEKLPGLGIEGAYADGAKNVIIPYGVEAGGDIVVIMAHTDVVFPDETPLPYAEDETTIRCPGIGDDTARLVQMLFALRHFARRGARPGVGALFVANACEEGLGNLAGSRAICDAFGDRIRAFVSIDASSGHAVNRAVGSERHQVAVSTRGGHSWSDFGNRNAIAEAAALIQDLYGQQVPAAEGERTTYNVGLVSGGTSVNTIAERASFLYEYRSTSRECLATMRGEFGRIVDAHRAEGVAIEVECVGERPCGGGVDPERQGALEAIADAANRAIFGAPLRFGAGSTDANIPLSRGIPALTVGSCVAPGAHTREERLEKASLVPGLAFLLAFFQNLLKIE